MIIISKILINEKILKSFTNEIKILFLSLKRFIVWIYFYSKNFFEVNIIVFKILIIISKILINENILIYKFCYWK